MLFVVYEEDGVMYIEQTESLGFSGKTAFFNDKRIPAKDIIDNTTNPKNIVENEYPDAVWR